MTNVRKQTGKAAKRPTPSMEQYVEAIAQLLNHGKVCSVSDIAAEANVSRPAASRAVRDLAKRSLVEHKAYGYVDLTAEGRALAGKLDARHEALQAFFTSVLAFDDETADEEACRLEHLLDDQTIGRLAELTTFLAGRPEVSAAWCSHLSEALGESPEPY